MHSHMPLLHCHALVEAAFTRIVIIKMYDRDNFPTKVEKMRTSLYDIYL